MKKLIAVLLVAIAGMLAGVAAAAMNAFRLPTDAGGGSMTFLRPPPTYVDVRVLAANTNEDHTVPSGAKYLIISSSCTAFYAKVGGSAAVPNADVTDGTASELNPSGYFVTGVSTIGFISGGACILTLSFYQ